MANRILDVLVLLVMVFREKHVENLSSTYCNAIGTYAIFAPKEKTIVSHKEPSVKTQERFSTPDEKLFEAIYNQHLQRVVSFAYGYLNDMEDARNTAHDVFISFWNSRDNVTLKDNVLPYLMSITRNKCLNILKKNLSARKYSGRMLHAKYDALNSMALESHSAMKIYETELETLMNRAIEQMKPKVKDTFLQSRIKGLKNREIASAEGIAESTVEARIKSALLIMRKLLKDYL